MPTGENFGTNVPATFITAPAGIGVTSINVNSSTGWPTPPFPACFGIGTSLQEPIYVTAVSGTAWTITRGDGGSTQQNQPSNQTVTHTDIGRHFNEFRAHLDSAGPLDAQSEAVHGLTNTAGNAVMGTKEVQTVTNKTLTSPTVNTPSVTGGTYSGGTFTSPTITTPTLNGSGGALTLPAGPDTLVARATTDTLTNKTISAGTFTGAQAMGTGNWSGTGNLTENTLAFAGITGANAGTSRLAGTVNSGPPASGTFNAGDIVADGVYAGLWVCVSGGSPGTWLPLSGRFLIGSASLTGTGATIGSISGGFTHLEVVCVGRTDGIGGGGLANFNMQINGDTTANYSYIYNDWFIGGTAAQTNTTGQTSAIVGHVFASKFANPGEGVTTIQIPGYKNTSWRKNWTWISMAGDGTTDAGVMATGGGSYATNANAITSITILPSTGNFLAGSTMYVYGLA